MGTPIEDPRFANAQPRPRFDPYTGQPIEPSEADPVDAVGDGRNFWSEQKAASQGVPVDTGAVNPYAPTGWQKRHREEFDITLPSGQLARVIRLEREDLFRLNLMGYLDTFTPMLMEDTISSEERGRRIRERMSSDPNAVANMFMAIDQVVMAATVRPRVTDKQDAADYGGPSDWRNPNFVATAYVNDITMDDRFTIFAAAFGRSMDDLKSVLEQAPGVASVADQSSV